MKKNITRISMIDKVMGEVLHEKKNVFLYVRGSGWLGSIQ